MLAFTTHYTTHRLNVGPMLGRRRRQPGQHWPNIGSMYRVCWVGAATKSLLNILPPKADISTANKIEYLFIRGKNI